jgi:gliding motility-associated-like protein
MGDLPEMDPYSWTSQSFLFTAPANGAAILKIVSNAAAGCGNEFAIDDISFRPCGPSITTAFVNNTATQLVICETNQQNIPMTANYTGTYANPVYQWQVSDNSGFSWTDIPGATTINYVKPPTPVGEYWYRCWVSDASIVASNSCRFASDFLKIQVVNPPFAQATNYVFGCYGSTVYLFAAGGTSYEWTGPNGFFANVQGPAIPNVNFSHTGQYVVKVTSTPGCFAYDTTTITIYAAPVATLTPTAINICEGDSVQLNAGGSLRYRWSPPVGLSNDTIPNPFAKPTNDITYTVRVYNEYTCYDTAVVSIKVLKKPKAFAGPDQFFRKGKPVQLNGNATGANVNYSWSPSTYLDNPNVLTPVARPPATIIYTLTVRSNVGCGTSTDDVKLEIIDKLFIPNAFTPNRDGLNDKWEIITFDEYEAATVEVFNRWGQVVYRGTGKNYKPWDGMYKGKPVSPDTYVYLINLRNGKPVFKGTLHLIR